MSVLVLYHIQLYTNLNDFQNFNRFLKKLVHSSFLSFQITGVLVNNLLGPVLAGKLGKNLRKRFQHTNT